MQTMIDEPARFEKTAREAKQIVFSLLDCEKPVIAKVNGHATGLGATIALFCDVIFASERAKIGDPHVSVGFVAGDGGAVIWPQLVGYARAKEFLMTGDLITARQAAEIGLINYAVAPEKLDETVEAFARKLQSGASKAIRWTKMSVNIGLTQLAHSIMYEAQSNRTADHAEAVAAFREGRQPRFVGT
jgi:enoyl-CoA hydratase